MASTREEIARDLVVAAIEGRNFISPEDLAELYKSTLKAVREAASQRNDDSSS